jgi:putative N6-adenine-specific DNA methylase
MPARPARPPADAPTPDDGERVIVTCRGGLEGVVAGELRELGAEDVEPRKRAVLARLDMAGVYRANMALRCALGVLRPLRTFNARNYDMLYYQSRKTNWHKLFPVEADLRIDVKGHSDTLDHTQFVVHRVKDGIVDTFRKLCGGRRPSIDKRDPDVHIVVYLDGPRATLCIDTSGVPLFKRGYRERHGEAPLKEDLAAGLVALSGWDGRGALLDPMCGSGTLLFEAWLMAARIAPNRQRRFGFEALLDYRPDLHAAEAAALQERERPAGPGLLLLGLEVDRATRETAERIRREHFPGAPIRIEQADFRRFEPPAGVAQVLTNPPYGVRLGDEAEVARLYEALGRLLAGPLAGCPAAVYTANHDAAPRFGGRREHSLALRNGALEGRLYHVGPR